MAFYIDAPFSCFDIESNTRPDFTDTDSYRNLCIIDKLLPSFIIGYVEIFYNFYIIDNVTFEAF